MECCDLFTTCSCDAHAFFSRVAFELYFTSESGDANQCHQAPYLRLRVIDHEDNLRHGLVLYQGKFCFIVLGWPNYGDLKIHIKF